MKLLKILNFIDEFHRTKNTAKTIKADPEKQPKSKKFGVSSILGSLLAIAFSFALVFGLRWLLSSDLFLVVAGAVIGLIGLAGLLASLYKAIEYWAFQLYINKKPITWISLSFWILAIAASVLIIIMLV